MNIMVANQERNNFADIVRDLGRLNQDVLAGRIDAVELGLEVARRQIQERLGPLQMPDGRDLREMPARRPEPIPIREPIPDPFEAEIDRLYGIINAHPDLDFEVERINLRRMREDPFMRRTRQPADLAALEMNIQMVLANPERHRREVVIRPPHEAGDPRIVVMLRHLDRIPVPQRDAQWEQLHAALVHHPENDAITLEQAEAYFGVNVIRVARDRLAAVRTFYAAEDYIPAVADLLNAGIAALEHVLGLFDHGEPFMDDVQHAEQLCGTLAGRLQREPLHPEGWTSDQILQQLQDDADNMQHMDDRWGSMLIQAQNLIGQLQRRDQVQGADLQHYFHMRPFYELLYRHPADEPIGAGINWYLQRLTPETLNEDRVAQLLNFYTHFRNGTGPRDPRLDAARLIGNLQVFRENHGTVRINPMIGRRIQRLQNLWGGDVALREQILEIDRFLEAVQAVNPERVLRLAEQNAHVLEQLVADAPDLRRQMRQYIIAWRALSERARRMIDENMWDGAAIRQEWANLSNVIRQIEINHPQGIDFIRQVFRQYTVQI
jgi:hypothetical protein